MRRTLEVPLDSLDAAIVAAPFADRLELCDDLASEGWTPDPSLIRAVRERIDTSRTSIVSMIRPRSANASAFLDVAAFTTTPRILEDCLREIDASAKAGADSVAIGLLTADGVVDMEACARMRDVALQHGLVVAFLRTFDLLADRQRGMDDITALGMTRVVTAGVSGWDASVLTLAQRLEVLATDVRNAEAAAARHGATAVEIVPGGGVRAANAAEFLTVSPHLHASCRRDGAISGEELGALAAALR
ncbi:MAG TPA: copper homeostasis protein CutC [Gemmatimonadaceae bacterium]|nr:copper homeostasis protein CutC [Gemmatimonadaceae bacterium]